MDVGAAGSEDEPPDYVDASVSFEMEGCPGRSFLIGNPHTHPRRMGAYSAVERRSFAVSLEEMTNVSPPARAWISGFLSGSEPGPPEFRGAEFAEAVENAWRAAALQFALNGDPPTVSEERTLAARDRIDVAANAVVSQSDFGGLLRILDALLRESSGRWTPVSGELFFEVWAATLNSAGDRSNWGFGTSTTIEADWHQLALSILRTVLTD